MQAVKNLIEILEDRIERAYWRSRKGWRGIRSTPGVWTAAAETLVQANLEDRSLPIDPELYVLAQAPDSHFADPWRELTGAPAIDHYRTRVEAIVAGLRRELAQEVRYAEARIEAGRPAVEVVISRNRRLSPLGRYIVAYRAGLPTLAGRFRHSATEQHRACPLYRPACSGFLPADVYPVQEAIEGPFEATPIPAPGHPSRHLWN